jgi:hypothetical protein
MGSRCVPSVPKLARTPLESGLGGTQWLKFGTQKVPVGTEGRIVHRPSEFERPGCLYLIGPHHDEALAPTLAEPDLYPASAQGWRMAA